MAAQRAGLSSTAALSCWLLHTDLDRRLSAAVCDGVGFLGGRPRSPPCQKQQSGVSECWLGEHCGTQTRLSHCGCYFCFRTMSELQERTFIAIKPDGVQRGIIGEIIKRFEMKGFKLVGMKMVQVRRVFPLSNQPAEDLQSLFKPHVRLNDTGQQVKVN